MWGDCWDKGPTENQLITCTHEGALCINTNIDDTGISRAKSSSDTRLYETNKTSSIWNKLLCTKRLNSFSLVNFRTCRSLEVWVCDDAEDWESNMKSKFQSQTRTMTSPTVCNQISVSWGKVHNIIKDCEINIDNDEIDRDKRRWWVIISKQFCKDPKLRMRTAIIPKRTWVWYTFVSLRWDAASANTNKRALKAPIPARRALRLPFSSLIGWDSTPP